MLLLFSLDLICSQFVFRKMCIERYIKFPYHRTNLTSSSKKVYGEILEPGTVIIVFGVICRCGSPQQSSMCVVPFFFLGQGNAQARLVADAMLDAVTDVLSQNTASPLTIVRIVIFQKPMLKDFHSSMQQREAADPDSKDKAGWTWGWSKFKCKYTEQRAFGFTFSNHISLISFKC